MNMPKLLFTPQTAKEMANKRWDAERSAKANHGIDYASSQTDAKPDALTRELEEEMLSTIREYSSCDDPKGKAALAQALRNLRETWHMVTGQAKPGNSKPSVRRPSWSPSVVSMPSPTPQPVVSGPDSSAAAPTEHKP